MINLTLEARCLYRACLLFQRAYNDCFSLAYVCVCEYVLNKDNDLCFSCIISSLYKRRLWRCGNMASGWVTGNACVIYVYSIGMTNENHFQLSLNFEKNHI